MRHNCMAWSPTMTGVQQVDARYLLLSATGNLCAGTRTLLPCHSFSFTPDIHARGTTKPHSIAPNPISRNSPQPYRCSEFWSGPFDSFASSLNEAHKPPLTIGRPPSHFNKQALPSTAERDAARPDARGMEARRRAYSEILTVCIQGAADRGPLDQRAKNNLNVPTKVVREHQ